MKDIMDITQGEFKDYYTSPTSKSSGRSLKGSRISSRGSLSCSMEYLSPEEIENTPEPVAILNNDNEVTATNIHNVELTSQDDFSKVNSSLSLQNNQCAHSNSSDSLSSQSDDDHEEVDSIKNSINGDKVEETLQDAELKLAIKQMKKLDRILQKRMKREQEVKKQRLLNQKNFYSMLEKLEVEKHGGHTYNDVTNNTAKYLALLPPPQQLDILLERQESSDECQPIFQTQFLSSDSNLKTPSNSSSDTNITNKPRASSSTERRPTANDEESLPKPSSAGSNSKRHKQHENDTDFIERNIQLAKDAGSYVAMTEDEKKRLDQLLQGIDEEDGSLNEENDAFARSVISHGEGYTPEPDELKHLQEIDVKLQALLSHSGYTSISTTPRLNQNFSSTSTEMTEIGRKIAKSKLTESLPPSKRLEEIEEKLLKLDDQWKEKFDVTGPRLTDNQLQHLLDECSRCTSPNSITTSSLSKLNFRDNEEHGDHVSSPSSFSESNSSLSFTSGLSSRCSVSSDVTLQSGNTSIPPKPLDKEVLERLLQEARTSLGIHDPESHSQPQNHYSESSDDSNDSMVEDIK